MNKPPYEPKHRGEPDEIIFEPGDRLRGHFGSSSPKRLTDHVFLVLTNGYVVEGDWIFYPSRPMTSKNFVKIGVRR